MNIFHKILNKIDWKINVSRSQKELKNNKLQVLNYKDSLDYLIESKCSLTRFGDGEFTLMLNGEFLSPRNNSLKFQQADPHLKNRLINILKDRSVDQYNLKIAIPRTLVEIDRNNLVDTSIGFWQNYLHELFYKVNKLLRKDYSYLNSQISRFYLDDRNKNQAIIENNVNKWKELWKNQDLLIIEGRGSDLGKDSGLYEHASSIQRIECPNSNTFQYYNEILDAARKFGKDKLILISLGPTAPVLAYDLAKDGFRAIDTGYLELEYHFFLTKATAETTINGITIGQVETIQNDPFPRSDNYLENEEVIYRILEK